MSHNTCPFWVGHFLAHPFRKIVQNPQKIISPHVKPGFQILEVGSGMGFFTIPMAKKLKTGHILAVDIEKRTSQVLAKKLKKQKLQNKVTLHNSTSSSLGVKQKDFFDFTFAFYVVHEIKDQQNFFAEVYAATKNGGHILVAEPRKHVEKHEFTKSVARAKRAGFSAVDVPTIPFSRAVLFKKEI